MAGSFRVFVFAVLVSRAFALDNGAGQVPPMGYNTWNDVGCAGVSERAILQITAKMASLGLRELGYEYVNLDDCWASNRDSNGRLVPSSAFPGGMTALVSQVHEAGFKFGIYTDRGTKTCAGYPGSRGYEEVDATTFAEWGVDFVKHDSCHAPEDRASAFKAYTDMRDALNATGRQIFYSLCGWHPWYAPPDPALGYKGGRFVGNSWRISFDCVDWNTIYHAVQINAKLSGYAAPGGWNDPDMLLGSSPGTAFRVLPHQSRSQFNLWAVMAAPLLIGSKLTNLSAFDLATYTNREVIRVNQDPLGLQGSPVVDTCPEEDAATLTERGHEIFARLVAGKAPIFTMPACHQAWRKHLADGSMAVVLVNFDRRPRDLDLDFAADLGIEGGFASCRDLWLRQDHPVQTSFRATVGADGHSIMLRVTPTSSRGHNSNTPHVADASSSGGTEGTVPSVVEVPGQWKLRQDVLMWAVLIVGMAATALWLSFRTSDLGPRMRHHNKRNLRSWMTAWHH